LQATALCLSLPP